MTEKQQVFRYQKVSDHIEKFIQRGFLQPGDKLPSLRETSRKLNVSLSTVIQGYENLERMGLVQTKDRSGHYVRVDVRKRCEVPTNRTTTLRAKSGSRTDIINSVLHARGTKEILPFGAAVYDPSYYPAKKLARSMQQALNQDPTSSVLYDFNYGHCPLRKFIAFRSMDMGFTCQENEVIISNGAVHGLELALRAVTNPGDTVVVESPTYYILLRMLEKLQLKVVELGNCCDTGIHVDELEACLKKQKVAALVLIPNFSNPAGGVYPDEKKEKLAKLARKYKLPIIEDDVYGELYFGNERPKAIKSYDQEGWVIYVSSFSKTLAPGYRVGWVVPGRFQQKIIERNLFPSFLNPTPTQMGIAEFLKNGAYDKHLRTVRLKLKSNVEYYSRLLADKLPEGTKISRPGGGCVLWVEMHKKIDSVELFNKAIAQGVSIAPGSMFSNSAQFSHFFRLNCGVEPSEQANQAIDILANIIKKS